MSVSLASPVDFEEREKLFVWRRAYLARYLRMPPSEVERVPLPLLERYMQALGEILKAEAPKSTDAETSFT